MTFPIPPPQFVRRALACLALTLTSAHAATFSVTNTADSGGGSLRQAIADANAAPGADIIDFRIAGVSLHHIALLSELPQIIDPVTIDGYTQFPARRNTLDDGFNAIITVTIDGGSITIPKGFTESYGLTFRRGAELSRLTGVKVSNFTHGVVLANVGSVTVEGNKVVDNGVMQVLVSGDGNAIGRPGAGMRNLIAGRGDGISLAGDSNVVKNNYIGFAESIIDNVTLNPSLNGVTAYFGRTGVVYSSAAVSGPDLVCISTGCGRTFLSNRHQIGGLEGGEGNVIVGQGLAGIRTAGASNGDKKSAVMYVERNRLGVSFDGSSPFGFGNFFGVQLAHSGASMVFVQDNSIAGGQVGILVSGQRPITGAKLARNRIVGQAGMAIDLNNNGRDANDFLDMDAGNNNHQNFPVLSGAVGGGGWRLHSTALESFTLELFQSGGICKTPEADVHIGTVSVTTDAAGNATITGPISTLPGGFITATATDRVGNTSELSDCVAGAKLASRVEIVSWTSPLRASTQNSHYEMRVGGGGIFTPTGRVSLWQVDAAGGRKWLGSSAMSASAAIWDYPAGATPGAFQIQADYEGDSAFDPSRSNLVDVVVYDVKHTFKSETSDILRARFLNNALVPGSYEILAGSDIAAGVTGIWKPLGLAAGKTALASGKFIGGGGPSGLLARDAGGNMTLELFAASGTSTSVPIPAHGSVPGLLLPGWLPGSVVETGRFFNLEQQSIVVATGSKRFESRYLSVESLPLFGVLAVNTAVLRDESGNAQIASLSIEAVGDFNGDGHDDIIWNVNGNLEMVLMNMSPATMPMPVLPPITSGGGVPVGFTIAGVGDFDGDGRADIAWRGGDYYYVALMNGLALKEAVAAIPVNTVPAEWKIKAIADYDGDGKADLLWRNEGTSSPGVNVIYHMNGSAQPPGSRIAIVQAFLPLTTDFIDP